MFNKIAKAISDFINRIKLNRNPIVSTTKTVVEDMKKDIESMKNGKKKRKIPFDIIFVSVIMLIFAFFLILIIFKKM